MSKNKLIHWSSTENKDIKASFRFTKREVTSLTNISERLGLTKTDSLSFMLLNFDNFITYEELLDNIELINFIIEKLKSGEIKGKINRPLKNTFFEGVFFRNKRKFELLLDNLKIGYVELPLSKINTCMRPFFPHYFDNTHFYVINDIENLEYKGVLEND